MRRLRVLVGEHCSKQPVRTSQKKVVFTVQCSRQWLSSTMAITIVESLVRLTARYRVTIRIFRIIGRL